MSLNLPDGFTQGLKPQAEDCLEQRSKNRSIDLLAILKKNLNGKIFCYILKHLRMCTIDLLAILGKNLNRTIP